MIAFSYPGTLLLVALSLAPQGTHSIMATSNSRTYVWTQSGSKWALKCKEYPSAGWISEGKAPAPAADRDSRMLRQHNWDSQSAAFLENGDRVEQQNGTAFYTIDPGQPNENAFTIHYRK
jgi:hypothetical protein